MSYHITTPVTGQETPEKAKKIVTRQITEFSKFLTEILTSCGDDVPSLKALSEAVDAATDCLDSLQSDKLIFRCDDCGWLPADQQCSYNSDYCDSCFKEREDDREYYESLRYYR